MFVTPVQTDFSHIIPRTLDEVLTVLDATGTAIGRQVAKASRTWLSGRILLCFREEFAQELMRRGVSYHVATTCYAIYNGGDVILNSRYSAEELSIHLVHEALHAMGQGELKAWYKTLDYIDAAGLQPFMTPGMISIRDRMAAAESRGEHGLHELLRILRGDYNYASRIIAIGAGDRVDAAVAEEGNRKRRF